LAATIRSHWVVGVGTVAVEAAGTKPDADEHDRQREFVTDVLELVADLGTGGALTQEVQVIDFSDR
jgi:hypothetical protein